MTRQSKNNSHIWDNFMGTGASHHHRRHPYYLNPRDTSGCSTMSSSQMSILEYSREEYTVVSPRVKCSKQKRAEKPSKKHVDVYVTNRERQEAEPPKQLATWQFQAVRKEMYNPHSVNGAFEAYQQRVRAKKWAESKCGRSLTTKNRVTIDENTEIVYLDENPKKANDKCHKYQKLRVTNRRNDEIKIDNFTTKQQNSDDVEDDVDDDDVIRIQKTPKPGFYGTIEAEMCAERVAAHLTMACENMERLQFVTDAVYPQTTDHLKKLHEIDDDVRDFNSQMRCRRVKVPTSAGTTTQVAHFIINDN